MKKYIITIITLVLSTFGFSQNESTQYLDKKKREVVSIEEAQYIRTTKIIDNLITIELKNIEKNEVEYSETYRGSEPYGIWKYKTRDGIKSIDYNFDIKYSGETCVTDSVLLNIDILVDNVDLNYIAPKFSSRDGTFYNYIRQNLIYPRLAIDGDISGTVYLRFSISEDSSIKQLIVLRGRDPLLDKEAFRIIRQIKFENPPMLNNKYTCICLILPIRFRL